MKGKEEKERYTHLNAEFQRIARRDKKAFLRDKCKELEENNRTGKTRDLFKKISNTKGTFHAKMSTIKDRNGMDLTEAEDIKKRWQEYTEELYKKDLHDPDNHEGMITDLESDILECQVKWALGSMTTNKACGGDGIPVELFQILKDDALKVLHSIHQQIWKTQQWPQDWKRSVFVSIPKKGHTIECSNYHTIALISHASKVMLKILTWFLPNFESETLNSDKKAWENLGGRKSGWNAPSRILWPNGLLLAGHQPSPDRHWTNVGVFITIESTLLAPEGIPQRTIKKCFRLLCIYCV